MHSPTSIPGAQEPVEIFPLAIYHNAALTPSRLVVVNKGYQRTPGQEGLSPSHEFHLKTYIDMLIVIQIRPPSLQRLYYIDKERTYTGVGTVTM